MHTTFDIIPFNQHQILTAREGKDIHVVMKPIVEALGLDWAAQRRRIANHPAIRKGMALKAIPSPGGIQEVVTLQMEQFHGWLITLTPERITDEARREVIIDYQERAFRVIFEHFHGAMGATVQRRSTAGQVALQNQVMRLTAKLQKTGNKPERRMMHAMLTSLCEDLAIPVPALEELGSDAPDMPEILTEFWHGIDNLNARGIDFNHSRKPGTLAISLREIEEHFATCGIACRIDRDVRAALHLSTFPRFIASKSVNSRLLKTAKTCWLFDTRQ